MAKVNVSNISEKVKKKSFHRSVRREFYVTSDVIEFSAMVDCV